MVFTKNALLGYELEALEYLELILEEDGKKDRSDIVLRKFFEDIDYDTLTSDLELIEEVRNTCSRNEEFEHTDALDDAIAILYDLIDSAETCKITE